MCGTQGGQCLWEACMSRAVWSHLGSTKLGQTLPEEAQILCLGFLVVSMHVLCKDKNARTTLWNQTKCRGQEKQNTPAEAVGVRSPGVEYSETRGSYLWACPCMCHTCTIYLNTWAATEESARWVEINKSNSNSQRSYIYINILNDLRIFLSKAIPWFKITIQLLLFKPKPHLKGLTN